MLFEPSHFSSLSTLMTPGIGSGPGGNLLLSNPPSPDFLLFDTNEQTLNNVNNKSTTFPCHDHNFNEINHTNNNDNTNSHLLFDDVDLISVCHSLGIGCDTDIEKSELLLTSSPSLDLYLDSYYLGLDDESGRYTDDLDVEKWIALSAFPSPPIDNSVYKTDSEDIEEADSLVLPWVGEECTIGSIYSPPSNTSMSFAGSISMDENTQATTASSAPSSPVTDAQAPSSPPSSSKDKRHSSSNKKKRGNALPTVERKMRKKSQNKTAAEKYRVKKKTEKVSIQERHITLMNANRSLKLEVENMSYRVEQLKRLFLDLLPVSVPSS